MHAGGPAAVCGLVGPVAMIEAAAHVVGIGVSKKRGGAGPVQSCNVHGASASPSRSCSLEQHPSFGEEATNIQAIIMTMQTLKRPCLLDLPDPWLHATLCLLDPDSKLSMLQTCNAMKSRLLKTQRVALHVVLDTPLLNPQNVSRIQTVLQQASSIKLLVDNRGALPAFSLLSEVLFHLIALQHGPLHNITAVYLLNLRAPQLVPTCLVLACPNMRELKQGSVQCGPPYSDKAPPLPVCSQLTALHIHREYGYDVPYLQTAAYLRTLPNLTALTIPSAFLSAAWDELHSVSKQLTKLGIVPNDTHLQLPAMDMFTCLEELDMKSGWVLGDAGMEVLLRIPSLKSVSVSVVKLPSNHARRSCSWECLSIVDYCSVASVAYLPLVGIKRLQLDRIKCKATDNLEAAKAAVANAGHCREWMSEGFRWDGGGKRRDDVELHVAGLLILQHIIGMSALVMDRVILNSQVLAALTQNMPSCVRDVSFLKCSYHAKDLSMLLHSMPAHVTWVELCYFELSELQLAEICVAACRPITLFIYRKHDRRDGLLEELMKVQAAAGHQHVTVELED